MIINELKLKDFISHSDTQLEFPRGVVALVGPNGSGKTSIIDAIVFSLFKEKVRGDRYEDLIHRGSNSAEVQLTFEVDGKEYILQCIRKKRTSEVTLERSDIGTIATSGEVLNEVRKILGMDKESAMNSIFIRQGEISSLIDKEPRHRRNLIGRLVGLDKLENTWQKMAEVVRQFESKAENYPVLKREIEIAGQRRKEIVEEISKIDEEISKLKSDLEKAEENKEKAENEFNTWKKKKDRHHELKETLAVLSQNISSKNEQIEKLGKELDDAKQAKEEMEKIEPEIKKVPLLEDYNKTLNGIEKLETTNMQLNKELERISGYKRELKETEDAYTEYTEKDKKIKEINGDIEELRAVEGRKAEIDASIKSLLRDLENAESELDELSTKALEVLPDASLEAKEELLKKLKERRDGIDSQKTYLDGEVGRIKGRLDEINEFLTILGESSTCPVCQSPLDSKHRDKVRNDFDGEINELKNRQQQVNDKLSSLGLSRTQIEEEIRRVSEIDVKRIGRLKEDLQNKTKRKEELQNELDSLKPELEKLNELRTELKTLQNKLGELKDGYESYITASRTLKKEREENKVKTDLQNVIDQIEELQGNLKGLIDNLGYTPEDSVSELKELRTLEKRYEVLKSKAERVEEIEKSLKELRGELEKLVGEKNSILEEIEELQYSDEKYKDAEKRFNELKDAATGIRTKLDGKSAQREQEKEELENLDEDIKRLEKEIKELEKIKGFVGDLERIRSAFSRDGAQKLLRKRIAPIITEYAQKYVERFNLDITDVTVSEDFDISVIKEGGEVSIKSMSGGEKVAVAIALRLAIAKVLSGKISTVIMDEPTTHLDEERRRDLVDIMKNFFREGAVVPQMVIITHHRELEEIADTVYQVEKVDGDSKVTEVSL